MKKSLLASLIPMLAAVAVHAQNQESPTPGEVKADGKVRQEAIKADTKINKALTKEAQENVKADAEADRKKLKAQRKAKKEVNEAVADVEKANTKAQAKSARESR